MRRDRCETPTTCFDNSTLAAPYILDHIRRNDLLAVVVSAEPYHFSKSRQIAEREIEPRAGEFNPAGIDSKERILLDPEPAPEPVAQHFRNRSPHHLRDHPGQRVGVDGPVNEFRPVRIFLLETT